LSPENLTENFTDRLRTLYAQ